MKFIATVKKSLERTLLIWLVITSGLACWWVLSDPEQSRWIIQALKVWTLTPAIVTAMFCIGVLLPVEELKLVALNWPQVVGGTCTQYLSMPLLAWLLAQTAGLEGTEFIGLIIVGSVPGAMASNVLTLTARGNVSYSISLTTLATLLSPVCVPLALWFSLGEAKGPPSKDICLTLVFQVVLPVILGFFLKVRFWNNKQSVLTFASIVANLSILWIIALAMGLNAERIQGISSTVFWLLLLLNGLGYLAGWFGHYAMRLDAAKGRALTLEIGMQNAGVGTLLALSFFDDPAVAIPPATYTFACMFTGTLLAQYWNWKSREVDYQSDQSDQSDS